MNISFRVLTVVGLVCALNTLGFAQVEGGSVDGQTISQADMAFIKSCGEISPKGLQELKAALGALNRGDRTTALKHAHLFRHVAEPMGKWHSPELQLCYSKLEKRIHEADGAVKDSLPTKRYR